MPVRRQVQDGIERDRAKTRGSAGIVHGLKCAQANLGQVFLGDGVDPLDRRAPFIESWRRGGTELGAGRKRHDGRDASKMPQAGWERPWGRCCRGGGMLNPSAAQCLYGMCCEL